MEDAKDEEAARQLLLSVNFWIHRVIVPIVVCIGVGGNAITIMVLTRRRMRSTTNIYLSALAVADVIYLLFVFFISFEHYPNIHERKYELYWRFKGLAHWLCDAASSTSVWLTVSFTLERYIAVCHPIRGKVLCTENRAKSILVIISLLCLILTFPTAFEYQLNINETCLRYCEPSELNKTEDNFTNRNIHYTESGNAFVIYPANVKIVDQDQLLTRLSKELKSSSPKNVTHVIYVTIQSTDYDNTTVKYPKLEAVDKNNSSNTLRHSRDKSTTPKDMDYHSVTQNDTEMNGTCCEIKTSIDTEYTDFGNNVTYITTITWLSVIVFCIVPLLLLIVFNSVLINAVHKSQQRRKKMTNTQESMIISNENRITLMLISVVILFLLCQLPTAVILIYTDFYKSTDLKIKYHQMTLNPIGNLMVSIHASGNFLLYCVLSKKFRLTFRKLFFDRKIPARTDTIAMSLTSTTRNRSSQRNMSSRSNNSRRANDDNNPITPRNLETQSLIETSSSPSNLARNLHNRRPPG